MDNFLIIRLSSLGDIIHTLPAFSALRKSFPLAKISWLVEGKGKEILDLVPGIDRILIARTKGWPVFSRKFWAEMSRLKKELKQDDVVALDFQGLLKSGFFSSLSRAKKRIGFHWKNLREPLAALFYTERLEEVPETIHVIDKNLKLLTRIGIKEERYDFSLSLPDEMKEGVRAKLREIGYDRQKKLVILNIGAAWRTKRWFVENWVKLAGMLKKRDHFLLLLWGNEQEKALAAQVQEKTGIAVSPFLTIKEVVALVKESSLLISGDTFALQAACALSRPVVGIFGPTNPGRNGPFSKEDKVAFHEIPCSLCYKRRCSKLDCLKKITAEEVASLSLQVLKNASVQL